jgi:hypothetical protein
MLLGVRAFSDFFRKPSGFIADHLSDPHGKRTTWI